MAEGFYRAVHGLPEDYSKERHTRLREEGWRAREDIAIGWGNVAGTRAHMERLINEIPDTDAYRTKLQYGARVRTLYSPLARIHIGEQLAEIPALKQRSEALREEIERLKQMYGEARDTD